MNLSDKDRHLFLKCVEELNELALELLHAVNKPSKDNWNKICNEIQDVESWILKIKNKEKC